MKEFKVNQKIQWKWLGRKIDGVVKEVFYERITKTIKNKQVTRIGSKEKPAYLVESVAGNLALKLHSELNIPKKKSVKDRPLPFLGSKD